MENAHKNNTYYSTLPSSQLLEIEEGVQATNSFPLGFEGRARGGK